MTSPRGSSQSCPSTLESRGGGVGTFPVSGLSYFLAPLGSLDDPQEPAFFWRGLSGLGRGWRRRGRGWRGGLEEEREELEGSGRGQLPGPQQNELQRGDKSVNLGVCLILLSPGDSACQACLRSLGQACRKQRSIPGGLCTYVSPQRKMSSELWGLGL